MNLSGPTYLWSEETGDGDAGGQADGHRHGSDPHRHVVSGAEVERDEGQPDDARRVHGEACNDNQEGSETHWTNAYYMQDRLLPCTVSS